MGRRDPYSKNDLNNARQKALKRGDYAEAERLQAAIDRLIKYRGDRAAGLPTPAFAGPKNYALKPGDSPASLAGSVFGDPRAAQAIYDANPDYFYYDYKTESYKFTGQPGDVLDLSFIYTPGGYYSPGLFTYDERQDPNFGYSDEYPATGVDPVTGDAPGQNQRGSRAQRPSEYVTPVGDPRTGGSFTPDQLAPRVPYRTTGRVPRGRGSSPPGPRVYGDLPPLDVGKFVDAQEGNVLLSALAAVGGGLYSGFEKIQQGFVDKGYGIKIPSESPEDKLPTSPAGPPGRPSVAATATTEGSGASDREAAQQAGEFVDAFLGSIADFENNGNSTGLPLDVPGVLANMTADAMGEKVSDLMYVLGFAKLSDGTWHRFFGNSGMTGVTGPPGRYAEWDRSWEPRRPQLYKFRNGRLTGPGISGGGGGGGRNASGGYGVGPTISWNVRFGERT